VENAIKHGIAKRAAGGTVRVAGVSHGGKLYLSIYNDGADALTDGQAASPGVGIRNLRTRLQILHGSESELQLRQTDTGGVEAVVSLPLKEA
jgi:two-component system LytT family sensor kinase